MSTDLFHASDLNTLWISNILLCITNPNRTLLRKTVKILRLYGTFTTTITITVSPSSTNIISHFIFRDKRLHKTPVSISIQ